MLSCLCKRVFPVRHCNQKTSHHVYRLLRKPFSSPVDGGREITIPETASALMSAFSLPYDSALSVAARSKLKSKDQIVDVGEVLRDFGFSKGQMRDLAVKHSWILRFKPEATLKPKLEFFRSSGFETSEIADIFAKNPTLFSNSLERKIVPCIGLLKTLFPNRDAMLHVLKTNSRCLLPEHTQNIIEVLRSHGVDEPVIWKMLTSLSRSCSRDVASFTDAIQKIKEFGVEPGSHVFYRAIGLLGYMSKATWERKVALYRSLGWSDDEVRLMFSKQPNSFSLSDELIKSKMNFFLNKLGWDSAFLASHPTVMHLSLHKRIIPRCSVLNVLMSKGLIKNKTKSAGWLLRTDKDFFYKYVNKYKDDVPEVVDAYMGKLPFEGWL